MSASPMATHCQHACKCFALFVGTSLFCRTVKLFLSINTDVVSRKTLKLVHYCILLLMVCRFVTSIIALHITLCNKTSC